MRSHTFSGLCASAIHDAGVRALSIAALLLVATAASPQAHAQLPFFNAEPSGAALRMASSDQLTDEISGFLASVQRQHEEAQAQVQGLEAEQANSPKALVAPDSARRKLLGLARQRLLLLSAARSVTKRASEVAVQEVPAPDAISLEELVDLHVGAGRLVETFSAQMRTARRLEDVAPDALVGSARSSREVAEAEVQVARASAARGRAYEAQAQARHAARIADAARDALVLTPRELAQAASVLSKARARVEGQGMGTAPQVKIPAVPVGTSSVAAARYEQEAGIMADLMAEAAALERDVLSADVMAAEAMVWAFSTLDGRSVRKPSSISRARVQAQFDRCEAQRQETERQLLQLGLVLRSEPADAPWSALLIQQEGLLEKRLNAAIEEGRRLRRALVIDDVVDQVRLDRQHSSPWWQTLGLIVAALGLGFMLLKFGGQFWLWMLAPRLGRLRLNEKQSASAAAVASLLWPLVVLLSTVAVIIWPILGLQLSLLEAVRVVNHPLFYVDETGVSPVSIVQFILTVWAAVVISRLTRRFLSERVYDRTGWDTGLTNALNTLTHYMVLLIGSVVGLRFVGIGLSSLAILAGVLGIGIGFGLRNITENFISGLIILAERPIKIGDFIEVKDGEVEGRVERIQARSTTVTTRDNITMIIPNSEFVSRPVVNWSHGDPKVRVPISVGVAYGSDTDLVRKVLLEVAARHGKVLKKPAPEVQFRGFGGSSLDFLLLVWIEEQYTRFRIASDLHFAIDKAFRKRAIEIAFPQMDVHFKSLHPSIVAEIAAPQPPPAPPSSGPNIPDQKSIRPGAAGPRKGSSSKG